MPQVPYEKTFSVSPQNIPTPSVNVSAPPAAFGAQVAGAIEGLGKATEGAGDEIFKRAMALQELKNETEAKDADTQYMMKLGDIHAKFSALSGKAAVDGYSQYMKDIQDTRTQIRDGLSNDMSRKMYDGSSLSNMSRTIFNGAGHAAQQNKVWAAGASAARVDMMANSVSEDPNDDVNFRRQLAGAKSEVQSQGDIHGWDAAQTEDQDQRTESKMWAHRITGLAKTAPFKAEQMFNENKTKLHVDDAEKVENSVRQQLRTTGARGISDEENDDLNKPRVEGEPERSLQLRIESGMSRAREVAPNDPLFPDFVKERITSDYQHHKAVLRDDENRNTNILDSAIQGNLSQGHAPTSIEQLKSASPEVAAAYDALPANKQLQIYGQIRRYSAAAQKQSELAEFMRLKGMAEENPSEFISMDITKANLGQTDMKSLFALQQKKRSTPEKDPQVSRALGIINQSGMLNDAGISNKEDPERYHQFVGTLQDVMADKTRQGGKPPTYEEVKQIGARLLAPQWPAEKFKWPWQSGTPLFESKLSNLELDIARERFAKNNPGLAPSDEQLNREFARQMYTKMFAAKPSKPKIDQ